MISRELRTSGSRDRTISALANSFVFLSKKQALDKESGRVGKKGKRGKSRVTKERG